MVLSTATEWGSSRWAEFERCEVAHALAYEPNKHKLPLVSPFAPRRIRAGTGLNPLEVGSLVHAGLEVLALNQRNGTDRDWADALLGNAAEVFEAQRLLQRYVNVWGASWSGFDVVEAEFPVALNVGPLPWSTRLDTLLRDKSTDRLVIVDHKTRGSMPSGGEATIRDEARVRPQFLGAIAATRIAFDLDHNPDFIVDVIVKTKTPGFYRVRFEAPDTALEAWVAQQTALAERYASGTPPIRNLHACQGLYSLCEFYDKCHGA